MNTTAGALIEETTTAGCRQRGERAIVITHESRDTRLVVAASAHLAEDLVLDGDAPIYSARPGVVIRNTDLAAHLMLLASALLTRQHENTLTSKTDTPVCPYSPTDRSVCLTPPCCA